MQFYNMHDLHISLRSLLGPNHGPRVEEDVHDHEEDHSDHGGESITRNLRIAAVFIILAAGLIGGLPPLFIKAFRQRWHPVQRIVRALSAGIILSLALVHIIPEAVYELGELGAYMGEHPYNVAGCAVMFGILLMLALENLAQVLLERRAARISAEAAGARTAHDKEAAAAAASATNPVGSMMGDPHTHVCIGHTNPLVLDGIVPEGSVRDQVMAIMFELGCVFHSFIIGLAVGVQTDDLTEVRALTIALAFHQALEAIALGSFIMRAGVSFWKGLALVGIYAATCPVGVAIGIGVAETYDPESVTAIATQGVFNGLSGGMLLYVALIQLLAEDFSRREVHDHGHSTPAASGNSTPHAVAHAKVAEHTHKDAHHNHHSHEHTHNHLHAHGAHAVDKAWVTPASYAALLLGAASMAMLGIWA